MKKLVLLIIIALFPMLISAADGNRPAPDFDFQSNGESVSLKQLKGKVVLLDFWASWCIPCRRSFPWMNEMKQKYHSQGLEIVAINVDKERADAEAFLSKVKADFIIGYDPDGTLAAQYELKGMPSSFLIGKEGEIVKSHVGFFDSEKDKMELEIRQVLNL